MTSRILSCRLGTLAGALLWATQATGCGGDATEDRPYLNASDFDPSRLPTRVVTVAELSAAPVLRLAEPPGSVIPWKEEDPALGAATLPGEKLAVLSTERELLILSPSGNAVEFRLAVEDLVGEPYGPYVQGDDLLVAGSVVAVRVFPEGRVGDSIPLYGRLRGVFPDGTLLVETWGERDLVSGGPVETARVEITFQRVPPGGRSASGRLRTRTLLVGFHESLGPSYAFRHLPWHGRTRGVLADRALWASPISGPALVELSQEGRPVRLLRWATDELLPWEEAEAWRGEIRMASRLARRREGGENEAAADSVLQWYRDKPVHAIDALLGGADGTLWVRNRQAIQDTSAGAFDTWLGFTASGEVVGSLRVPTGTMVFEITRDRALVDVPGDDLPPLLYRLLPRGS